MKNSLANIKFKLIFFLINFSLYGCNDHVILNSNLLERDANEIMGVLVENDIDVKKVNERNGVSISVESENVAQSLYLLRKFGLPKAPYDSLGTMFDNGGMVSTPLEERARYIYALSQELEYTLSEIDGVVIARVHLVIPQKVTPGKDITPASASVFIKHQSFLDPDVVRVRIKNLIAGAVPGLSNSIDKVSLVFIQIKNSSGADDY